MIKYLFSSLLISQIKGLSPHAAPSWCPQNDHSVDVESLPYKQGDLHECQYAGTLETSLTAAQDHHLFYWYFKN